jgi:SAM-dependent methyltransferase
MMELQDYSVEFFDDLRQGSRQSAEAIVPLILQWFNPKSVVDVGCGDGTWLSVFQAHGLEDILGLDGSYVKPEILQIPQNHFIGSDLSHKFSLDRTFDLAISLEVAEHLPEESARGFVESLVRLSNLVLFSAAIPHQGGTNHINEQWPDYWISLFADLGYIVIDAVRERIWDLQEVEPWYAQNSFLFVRGDRLNDYPRLQGVLTPTNQSGRAIVHPSIYLQHCPTSLPESPDESTEVKHTQTVQILGVNFDPSGTIQSGEALTIKIDYQIMSPIEAAILNLSLSDETGTILLDTDTEVTPLPADESLTHSIELHIDRLDLVQGKYFINPGIFSLDWKQTYDFHWHRYPLTIEASVPQKGLLHPPMHWHRLINQ